MAAPQARAHSRSFYKKLRAAARRGDAARAEKITRAVMQDSLKLWRLAADAEKDHP